MAARYFTGIDGKLLLDGQQIAKIQQWSFSSEIEALETTTTGDTARKYIFGRVGWAGSCTAFYYEDSAGALTMAPLLDSTFRTAAVSNTQTYTMKFQLNSARVVEMEVLITGASIEAAAGDIITANINFVVTGYPSDVSIGEA